MSTSISLGKLNSKTNSYEALIRQGSYVKTRIGEPRLGARYVNPPRGWSGRVNLVREKNLSSLSVIIIP